MDISIKKRGRKPKIIDEIKNNVIEDTNETNDIELVKKKRGRKPKIITIDKIDNNISKELNIELLKNLDIDDSILKNVDVNIKKNNNFIEKYQVNTIDDIIDNKDQIRILKNWLLNFETSKYHTAVISGGHGVGKNLISKLILTELGYEIKNIYGINLKNKGILSEIINLNTKTNDIYTSNIINNKKYAVIIDDTESITLSSEKDNLIELFKFNTKYRYFPLILISNLQHSKLINNLKKISLDIIINYPSIESLKEYIIKICLKENIIITDDKLYLQIIKFCQFDIRKLLSLLQDLYYTYNNKPITSDILKEYQQMTQKKDIEIGLYNATKSLLNNYKSINDSLQLYETEKVLLPLTIYENYYKKLFKQKNKNILKLMSDITDSISIGDVIETNIYSDQNWFLQNIHGFYTCANTSYIINNTIPNNIVDYEVIFSADLNKTSSRNINKKKNILTLQSKFKDKNINDIIYINKIIYELDKTKNNNLLKKIKQIYNLDNKNIQIALKIDKTN